MTPADKSHVLIRCPSCSQKFKVGTELMGRTVECGGCEHRFAVSEEVMERGEKFYPGERDRRALEHFQRVPGPKIGVTASTPAVPGPHQEKGYYSPITRVSAFRIAMGWVGVVLILALVALLRVNAPGPLSDLPFGMRLAIAAAGGVVGVGLLTFANPRTRKRTVPISIAFAAIVLAVPFVFQSKVTDTKGNETAAPVEKPGVTDKAPVELTLEELRTKIGIRPLETEIRRLKDSGSGAKAYGIWLRDMGDSNRLAVRDYMIRTSGASPTSIIYPRENRDYLMVLTGLDKNLDEIAEITQPIALKQQILPELDLVEVKVDAAAFLEGPLDKLTDKADPAFYDLNKRELESIQLERVGRAARRLADAEPKLYRRDITRQLIKLLAMDNLDNYNDIARALVIWAEDPAEAAGAALIRLKRLHAAKKPVPPDLVELLAKSENSEALPLVEQLWLADAVNWERWFGDFGPIAEPVILARFPTLDPVMRHSAARLLARVGTKASLPTLETARRKAEPEMIVLIEAAEKAISERN